MDWDLCRLYDVSYELAIKKAVSHPSVNASVSAASIDCVMLFIYVELHVMGTEFCC